MPIYCDECEAVIDRDEELTRIEGNDYCLDCAPTERTDMTAPIRITNADIDRASLNAAAPDLLEQLQQARQFVAKVAAAHSGHSIGMFAARRLERMDAAITKATATPKPDPKVGRVHIELAAPNDINGNPQRLSMLIDPEDGVLATVDHGYEGSPRAWGSPATRITISEDEYSDWVDA